MLMLSKNIILAHYMNNHIYSTLFKTQERESDRRSKEIEQRKESQKKKEKKGHVTLSTELHMFSTCLVHV